MGETVTIGDWAVLATAVGLLVGYFLGHYEGLRCSCPKKGPPQ